MFSVDNKQPLTEYDQEVVDELLSQIDMTDLKTFNPKLHAVLQDRPEVILTLKDTLI